MEVINQNATPQAVKIDPSISGTFGHGWETLKRFFPELLLILFLLIIFSLPMGLAEAFADHESFGYIFFSLFNVAYGLVVMAPLSYGADLLFLKAIRGEPFKVTEIFFAYRQTLQIMLATILTGVIIGIGFVMLFIPGIIFACKLSMVPYLMMDKNMEAVDAVRTSWNMTKGFSWTIFGMGVVSFFVIIGGLILLVVGIIPAILWISLAFAAMYQGMAEQRNGGVAE